MLVENIGQHLVADAAHFRQAADRACECFQRLAISAALIIVEVVADMQRRAVAGVIVFEIVEISLQHLRAVVIAKLRVVETHRLRDQEIVVHRQGLAPQPGDADIGEAEAPQIVFLHRPGIGFDPAIGVIAEAPGIHDRVEAGARRQIRRTEARDLADRKIEAGIRRQSIIHGDMAKGLIECVEFALPVRGRPVPAVEMPDRMRGDLMPARMEFVDEKDARTHIIRRAAEIDARGAAPLTRGFVERFVGIGDEIHAGDEEGEMHAVVVAVHAGGEIRPFLPALELGAIVEGDRDILRRTIGGKSRRGNESGNH